MFPALGLGSGTAVNGGIGVAAVPVPASLPLLGGALVAGAALSRRRKKGLSPSPPGLALDRARPLAMNWLGQIGQPIDAHLPHV
ncbi:MAG: PEP-CTERM sorting domain-containing protein [Sedimentitalea sp.]